MTSQQTNIDFIKKNWIVLLILVFVVLNIGKIAKLFKGIGAIGGGVGDAASVVGDVLSAPRRIIDALNADLDNTVKKALYDTIKVYVLTHVYTGDAADIHRENTLKQMLKDGVINKSDFDYLLSTWKKPIPSQGWTTGIIAGAAKVSKTSLSLGAQIGLKASREYLIKRVQEVIKKLNA
jgi:hypothetical protein